MIVIVQNDQHIVLRLERSEEIIKALTRFAGDQNIKSAFFIGLGAVSQARVAFYNIKDRLYQWQEFKGQNLEIVNLTGNISLKNNKPFVHAHITLTDEQGRALGGHLGKAVVSGTCEIMIMLLEKTISRQFDSETGLWLLN